MPVSGVAFPLTGVVLVTAWDGSSAAFGECQSQDLKVLPRDALNEFRGRLTGHVEGALAGGIHTSRDGRRVVNPRELGVQAVDHGREVVRRGGLLGHLTPSRDKGDRLRCVPVYRRFVTALGAKAICLGCGRCCSM